jgi:Cu(I)/Ag(I) efflux system membrane protein CusA/SilA
MIAKLIDWCIRNRALVLLLTAFLIVAGVWAVFTIKVDAIPDLSDVQVIISTEYPGQPPEVVEKQVTYPLTNAMLAIPRSKVVRGLSQFGTSFVYIIFEDGTDIYWARSRVLERLSYVQGQLPAGVTPQIGPDATGVGWVYEYTLITGKYCPDHPNGAWHDPQADRWYEAPEKAPQDARQRLVHHRVFQDARVQYYDPQEKRTYDLLADAPETARPRLRKMELSKGCDRCPLDGKPLLASRQDLANLRSLQDWYLRYELTAVDGVSEVASAGGFQKQYQVIVDPVKLLAFNIPLSRVKEAVERSNANVGGRVVEFSEREYAVQGLGYLGTLSDAEVVAARGVGKSVEEARTDKVLADLKKISLGTSGASPAQDGAQSGATGGPGGGTGQTAAGSPIYLGDVADIHLGPAMRRGIIDWNGEGEAVGGIIVMRFGENARTTIEKVRRKLAEAEKGLPPGVAIEVGYDRSDLIDRSVATLTDTLIEEITVVAIICIFFLLHARSELVAVFVVPTGVLTSVLLMHLLGINANVMSLGGIAIAIGVMVDSSIVMVENSHKHLDREEERLHALTEAGLPAVARPRTEIIAEAAKEVGPSLFFALLTLTVSFLPVFVLGEQSGRLFKPLAFTKTFAMAASSFLAVTVIPVLMSLLITSRVLPKRWGWITNLLVTLAVMVIPALLILVIPLPRYGEYRHWFALGWAVIAGMLLVPQKIIHENVNPISKLQQWLYHPAFVLVMRLRWLTVSVAAAAVLWVLLLIATVIAPGFFQQRAPWALDIVPTFGSEFMPPLEEGDMLYMPTTYPGISAEKARELLQQTDKLILTAPEVESVMGKVGRAETATDPAPLSMYETTITLRRDKSRWRQVPVSRFFEGWPDWLRGPLSRLWPDRRPITRDELVYGYDLPGGGHVPGLQDALHIPGLTNSWTMPIRTRIDMLSTGIKTPVGVKIMGPDLQTLSDLAEQVSNTLQTDATLGPKTTGAYAEKTLGGSYIDIQVARDRIARYGLSAGDVQDVISTAMGGMTATTTVEGLDRYSVNVRYPQRLRDSVEMLQQTLVATPSGAQVPLGQLADFTIRHGPDMIRSEHARQSSWRRLRGSWRTRSNCPRATASSGPACSSTCRSPTAG